MKQAGGADNEGASLLVDGFKVTEDLKKSNPEHYKLLTETNFRFNDEGVDQYGEFDLQYERPVIK